MINIKSFFISWLAILLLNQIFIFNACLAPHCIFSALPHTGIIAFLFTLFFLSEEKKNESKLERSSNDSIPIFETQKNLNTNQHQRRRKEEVASSSYSQANINTENIQNYNLLAKMPYKEIPISDSKEYIGTILKKYNQNGLIILNIQNIGIYKIKLPQQELWDIVEENQPFTFMREKYNGNGKNSHVIYGRLTIVKSKVLTQVKEKCINQKLYYGIYHPWHNGNNPEFDSFSGKILDLKSNKEGIVNYFFNLLKDSNFDKSDSIVIVPSHDPQKTTSSVKILAQKLAHYKGLVDATNAIKRVKKIPKLAQGGNRDVSVHLQSITINEPWAIKGKNILVFDDIATTGNSLEATMHLLKEVGAHSVCAYTIGHTA